MSDQDDELARRLQDMRERYEAATLEIATEALAHTPDAHHVPMPDTAHPSLEGYADPVRRYLIDGGRDPIRIPAPMRLSATFHEPGDEIAMSAEIPPPVTLEIRRCAGAVPFVGDPLTTDARYVWTAAVDPRNGRHIAGNPAELGAVEVHVSADLTDPITSSPDDTIDPDNEP